MFLKARLNSRVALMALAALSAMPGRAAPPPLANATVRVGGAQSLFAAEGAVEAVRQSVISSQVAGTIQRLAVKAGDTVKAGQLLASIDARAANQTAAASGAQVDAARAELEVATRDYARQKQLFEQKFISQAALDRAEAQFKSARAQSNSLVAQAGAAVTQSGFYTLTAPYAGLVAEVPAMPGDMAMPGRALMTIYDPLQLRGPSTSRRSPSRA
jgi:RND family efflux transporter MFP subunit